jgi:glycosyltransferase involved in cell wall biosynthesis
MKVVFSTGQIYLPGGIEKIMATKANYFANQPNVEVYIVTTEQNNNPPFYPLDEKIRLIDLDVNYNRSISYFSLHNIKKAVRHFRRQRRLFQQLTPDTIISPNYNFDFYWIPFISVKAKKIKEIHASRYSWKPTFKNKLNAWFENKYDAIVVLNKDEADYFSSKNVVIIPNSIEIPDMTAVLDKKQVIAAGRIAPVKGFDVLILAWKEVSYYYPEWQLHIYGQEYLETQKKLEQLVKKHELQEVIFFKGTVNDLAKEMCNYSIYVMSSVTECFPMVLLEAMSVGLPIVSFDCPHGPRNIISNAEDGVLLPPKSTKQLAKGLITLIENEQLRKQMGKNAKNNVSRFATKEIMQKWKQLIKL